MNSQDIRWQQRLNNFNRALEQLASGVKLSTERPLTELEKQGLIQAFEFTHELAWNVIKDYFVFQGNNSITGSRDAIREAFNKQLITDGESWMNMIYSRNQSSHTYNQTIADEISEKICTVNFSLFQAFQKKMQDLVIEHK